MMISLVANREASFQPCLAGQVEAVFTLLIAERFGRSWYGEWLREPCVWATKALQYRRRDRTSLFGQKYWLPIVLVAGCVFEFNKAKSRTAASGSIGKIVNVLGRCSAMKLEPISILDRLVTFVQGDV
jgi:hypothetical protein